MASAQFQNAVKLEPENIKAKLLLAQALLQEYTPGTESAAFDAARQQYLEVIARDPRNQHALRGLLSLDVNTKRYDEAHGWALKAIQADPRDKFAYYSAGFVDWVVAYPDYAKA